VPEGGLVPKNLYITSSDEDVDRERNEDALLGPDAIYHTAYAVRDFPHEVRLAAVCSVSVLMSVINRYRSFSTSFEFNFYEPI